MKFSKSTTIFLNVLLILVIALLVKSLIAVPKDVYAKGKIEYKVFKYPSPQYNKKALEEFINKYANEGWKLHSIEAVGYGAIILER